ncbi:BspA family leucine-rich repeat surface protein, partial [Enterococcus faecium]|nr:BspA family leucine-rich repeat surface protein [Enterococcus faecium]
NVTNMDEMFSGCKGLTILDLSNWNCDKVTSNFLMFETNTSTPLLVKTTDTKLKNYDYVLDNRTKLGTVKIAAENGKFEGNTQELSLFDYTTDKDLTEASIISQLEERKDQLLLNGKWQVKEWTPAATYTTFAEKAGGTYTAEVKVVWEWTYDSADNVVTLTQYIGESKNVVIPTAKDCGHEGATAKISKEVLQQASSKATSLTTSNDGDKIVVSSTNLSHCFENNETLIIIDLTNLDINKVTDMDDMFRTSTSTPLLVKTTNTELKNYDYASDNRTKLGTVKIAAKSGKFEGDVQEVSLFDSYTTDQDFTEELIQNQLAIREKKVTLNEGYMFKEWMPEATYTTFAEKAGGTYTAEVKQADWEWTYDSTNNVVTLTRYIGESKDVVIPTAKDCGHEGATAKISKKVLQQAAAGANSLTTSSNGDKIVVSSTDLYRCFTYSSAYKLDLSNLDTSNVTSLNRLLDANSFKILDVSGWDTSNVTDMISMVGYCGNLKRIKGLNDWNTSNVTNMSDMFSGCSSLTSLDLSNWDTSNVTDMSNMFSDCSSLTSLNVSGWNTKKARVYYTFSHCPNLTILDLSGWSLDGTNVWSRQRGLFETSGATPLLVKTTDTKLKNYNYVSDNRTKLGTVKIAAENGKFEGNKQELTLFDAYTTDQEFNEELINSQLDTRKDQLVLADWVKFKEWTPEATYTTFAEKAGGTYTASVTHGDWKWTYDSTNEIVTLTEYIGESAEVVIPTAKDCGHEGATAKISKEVLQQAAAGANSLTTSNDGDKIVVSSTDLSRCFEGYATLTTIDLTNLDTSSVENMDALFYNCTALTELDVHNWDTSQVTSMIGTFNSCKGLTELDVSDWDTGKVENMAFLFYGCEALTNLTIGSWDTKNVTSMQGMFVDCHQLTSLKLNRWNTNKVTNMSSLFFGCTSLEELEI